MKALIIAMLLAGTALLLLALLWPDRRHPASQQRPHSAPVAATFAPKESEEHILLGNEAQSMAPKKRDMQMSYRGPTNAASPSLPLRKRSTSEPVSALLTPDEKETFKQTGTDDTSLRNGDFPNTYISKIHVDLASPNHTVTLTWSGPNARLQPRAEYHSSPGRGLGNNNCDDPIESCRVNSNCTPKGAFRVQAFSNSMVTSPECRYVTWFDTKRGIALHYYPNVPNYPASHGCVRLGEYAAHLIHNNSKIGETEVVVEGKWKFGR